MQAASGIVNEHYRLCLRDHGEEGCLEQFGEVPTVAERVVDRLNASLRTTAVTTRVHYIEIMRPSKRKPPGVW